MTLPRSRPRPRAYSSSSASSPGTVCLCRDHPARVSMMMQGSLFHARLTVNPSKARAAGEGGSCGYCGSSHLGRQDSAMISLEDLSKHDLLELSEIKKIPQSGWIRVISHAQIRCWYKVLGKSNTAAPSLVLIVGDDCYSLVHRCSPLTFSNRCLLQDPRSREQTFEQEPGLCSLNMRLRCMAPGIKTGHMVSHVAWDSY